MELVIDFNSKADKERLWAHLKTLKGKHWIVLDKETRTIKANSYYWKVVIQLIHDHTGQSKHDIHWYLKYTFLPEFERNYYYGESLIPGSTKKVSNERFWEYVLQCRIWAMEYFSIDIPEPTKIARVYQA